MRLLAFATSLLLGAQSAMAQDMTDLSDAERDAFRAEVRAYLLDNPEVLMEAIGVLEQRQAEMELARDEQLARQYADELFNDGHSHVGGNPDGDITIVEFIDYRCSFCRRAHPEVGELVKTDGNIRIIIKEYPILGEQSVMASQFAIATQIIEGDEAYKQVSDALIALRSDVSEASLSSIAQAFDLDGGAIFAEMNSETVRNILTQNRVLGERMAITGTPTFIFDDQMVRGYVDLARMRAIVAAEREDG